MTKQAAWRIVLFSLVGLVVLEVIEYTRFRVAHEPYADAFLVLLGVTALSLLGVFGVYRKINSSDRK